MNVSDIFSGIIETVLAFFSRPAPAVIQELFIIGGYLFFIHVLVYLGLHFLQEFRQEKFTHNWKWILLAVDIPALNVQTPKAVEQLFAHIAGAHEHVNIAEKYWHGHKQRQFSFEIISIEGYIQFLVRTESLFRELVEAAMYAQYPDADIVEVEDYVGNIPESFPNKEYDIWGADITLAENSAYPIRTYREFEHAISKDTVLKDPMGAFLESFTRIGPGEQMWFQIILEPVDNGWKEHAIHKIKEIIGDTTGHHGHSNVFLSAIGNAPGKLLDLVGTHVLGSGEGGHDDSHAKDAPPNQLQYLTPGQKKIVEAMEDKISQIGFKTKIRALYIARKEVFRQSRGVNALIGALNQFNSPTANSLVPSYSVGASYFGAKKKSSAKKSLIMKAYKKRKMSAGGTAFTLNVVELATIWHFPMSHVKTPLVQKVQSKAAEPPSGLPVEMMGVSGIPDYALEEEEKKEEQKKQTYHTDTGGGDFPEGTKFG